MPYLAMLGTLPWLVQHRGSSLGGIIALPRRILPWDDPLADFCKR